MNRPAGRARRARGRFSGALAAIAAAIVTLSPVSLRAEDVLRLAALGAAGPETLVVQVALNTQKKGQYFACAIDGELFLRAADLRAIGLVDARGQTRIVDGDEYVRLESVRGLRVRFDERRLALDLTADPGLLPAHTVDFWPAPKEDVFYPINPSAFLNYDFTHAGGNDGVPDASAVTAELGVRIGDFLFDSDGYCRTGGSAGRGCVRLSTSIVHDDRSTLVRTIAGDFPAGSGPLGGAVNMGGLSYSKLYNMDPYFLRFPQQAIAGQLRTPSEVDVYIDGQRVRQLTLPAGDFDLRNITQSVGYRAVDVVIRDAFGREQRISTSSYVTEALLKAGLHEYSYNVGALRENYGVESNDYGPVAFAGFHRYGVTDALTIGARAEGTSGRFNGGPSATFSFGSAGIVTVAGAVSDDHGRTGGAGLFTYSYLGPHVNAALFARKDSRHFIAPLAPTATPRNYDVGGTIGYTAPGFGTISAGVAVFKPYSGPDRTAVSGSYARTVFDGRASFFVTVVNERSEQRATSVFAGLVWTFDADYSLAANYQRFRGTSMESVQFQKALPVGEGLGYTIGAQHSSGDGPDTTTVNPSFQYNGRWGVLRGYATQQDGPAGTRRGYSVSASGALAWAGDGFALGRPITDGFGIVRVDAAEGVPVRVNGQQIGRTGTDGTLFVPTLASFLQNQVSIDAANVPLDLSFPDSVRLVSPAYRAGAFIDFQAKRLSAFTGTMRIRADGELRPAEFYQVTLAVAGRPVTFRTGRGGEFYVEDLKPGRYTARLAANGHACNFELVVPEATGPLTELPPIVCEAGR